MELKDPVTGEVVSVNSEVNSEASSDSVVDTGVLAEVVEEVKEVKDKKVVMMEKLEELRADRLISEIPISDAYWKYKKEIDHLL